MNGGADCAGDKTETRQCYAKPCPVNGVFGKWSKYSVCSASCGGGVQYRERKCNSPPPKYGGKDCNGPIRQTRYCAENKCPGNGKTFIYYIKSLILNVVDLNKATVVKEN